MKKIHPLFLLFFLWFLFTGEIVFFLVYCLAIICHEWGHAFVAKKLGYKINNFYLMPFGVSLNLKERSFYGSDEIYVAAAGPMLNIVICMVFASLWWVFPITYFYTSAFVYINLMLALFNLLPCFPMDGGRILVGVLSGKIGRKKAVKIVSFLNIGFALFLFALFIWSCFVNFNPTFALSAIFMVLGSIETKFEGRYELMLMSTNVNMQKGARVHCVALYSSATLLVAAKRAKKTYYNVFYIEYPSGKVKMLVGAQVEKLILTNDATKTFDEVLN